MVGNIEVPWSREETLALAQQSCVFCFGMGLRPGRAGDSSPCNCVFRAVFRACYAGFLRASEERPRRDFSSIAPSKVGSAYTVDQDYAADFCGVAKRSLTQKQHDLFRAHYLLCRDWRLCCSSLKLDRGQFFHEVYRIEQRLGRTFRELRPYALFPVDVYFHGEWPRKAKAAEAAVESVADASSFSSLTGRSLDLSRKGPKGPRTSREDDRC